jgi:hypothetical protein
VKRQHSIDERSKLKPKRKSVIQQFLVLLAVFATLCSCPAVSASLTGSAEKPIDERLQTQRLFKTAGSTPPKLIVSKAATFNVDMFSSASVWKTDAWWQSCRDDDLNCVLSVMKKSGAREDAMNFTKEISQEIFGVLGYLEEFKEKGRVDIGFAVFARGHDESAYVLLNGNPAVISTEQHPVLEKLDMSGDSNYQMLKKQYPQHPQLYLWPTGAGFVSAHADTNNGQRFIFDYRLVDLCYACYVGWTAQVAFDFNQEGAFKGITFLKLFQDQNVADAGIVGSWIYLVLAEHPKSWLNLG